MTFDLSNKVILVTGVSENSGLEICNLLASLGAEVWIHLFHEKDLNSLKNEICAKGAKSKTVIGPLSTPEDAKSTIERVLQCSGKIDILINHAEIHSFHSINDISPEEWLQTFEVNLDIPFLCAQTVLPKMIECGSGTIINISSKAAKTGGISPHFASSKSALNSFTKGLSKEYQNQGIRVIGLSVPTKIYDSDLDITEKSRLKESIANTILFLCTPYADYLNGETLPFNGEVNIA